MPYYKKKYRKTKGKRYKTNNFMSKTTKALSLASKGVAMAYNIKKLLNVEYKFHDVQVNGTSFGTNGSQVITQLTNIAQGDTSITRDGAQIKLTRIDIKYLINQNLSATGATTCRVMLVQDKQTNQAIYNFSDLLEFVNSNSVNSPLNLDNKYRFRVLANKIHVLNANSNVGAVGKISLPLEMRIRFDASTSAIADLTSNSLSVVFMSDDNTNSPAHSFISRIRYVDN